MAMEDQDVCTTFYTYLEAPKGCAICHEGAETDLLMANQVNRVTIYKAHSFCVVSRDLFWFIV